MMTYVINRDACIGCGACAAVCPMCAVGEADDASVIDAAKCIGCGACANLCPVGAVSVE